MTREQIDQFEHWLKDSQPRTLDEHRAYSFILRCIIHMHNMRAAELFAMSETRLAG